MILRFEHHGMHVTVSPALGEWHVFVGERRAGRLTMDASRPQEYILATQDHLEIGRETVLGSPTEEQLLRCGRQIAEASGVSGQGRPASIFHYEDEPPPRIVFVDRPQEPAETSSTSEPEIRRPPPPLKRSKKVQAEPIELPPEPRREFSEDAWDCQHEGVEYKLLTNYDPNGPNAATYVDFARRHTEDCWMREVAYDVDGKRIKGWKSIYVRKDRSISVDDLFKPNGESA